MLKNQWGVEEFKLPGFKANITQEQWKEFLEFKDEYIKELRKKNYLLQETNDLLGGRIDFRNLLASGIRGFNVKDGEITADKLSVTTLSAITADLGTITAGDITLDDEGFIRTSGKDNYADTTPGIFFGYDGGAYKLNIGSSTKYLTWDGSSLTIRGTLNASDLTTGTLSVDRIAAGSITATQLTGTNLSALYADLGTITAGNITLDSSGFIRSSGKDNYADTTAGFWLGYDTDAYKFNIGNSANWLKWTGSALQIKGRLNIGDGTSEDIYFEDSAIRMYDDLDGTKKKIGWKYGDLKFGEFFYNTTGRTHFVIRSGTNNYATVLYSRASDDTGFIFILSPGDVMPCWIRLNPAGHIVLSAVADAPTVNVTMGSFVYNSDSDRPAYRDGSAWRHWIGTAGW